MVTLFSASYSHCFAGVMTNLSYPPHPSITHGLSISVKFQQCSSFLIYRLHYY